MSDDSPDIVGKLPRRPLSVTEGKTLEAQETDSSWIRPESIALREDDQVVVALLAINRESGRCWLLGYSPDDDGWTVVDEWDYDELNHDSFYARLDGWEAETFAGRDGWNHFRSVDRS